MPDERRHESADLEDYGVLDSADTLDGAPGDDPLDRGVATPDRWSAGIRYGTTADEQRAGESLDQQLAEEEPDISLDDEGEADENATEEELGRYAAAAGPDPRSGRLVDADDQVYEDAEGKLVFRDDLMAGDEGIAGGGASAEEAAVHIVSDDTDQRGDR